MKKILQITLVFVAGFISSAQTATTNWQEDISYFKEQLVKKHKNPFHHVTKDEFEKDVEKLYQDAPTLKDYEIVVRLMQITAKVGDGHTNVHLPDYFHVLPAAFNWFGDDLYVTATTPAFKQIAGTRVLK